MALDASIYQLMGRGVKSVADYDREAVDLENARAAGESNKLALLLNRQKADEYTRATEEKGHLRRLLSGATTNEERIQRARTSGLPSGFALADDLEKADLDRQKTGVAIKEGTAKANTEQYNLGRKRYENRVSAVTRFTSADDAKQWLADGVSAGDLSMDEATKMIGNIPADPTGFQDWQKRTLLSMADAGKQAGYTMPDANAALQATTSASNNAATNTRTAAANAETARHNAAMEATARGNLEVARGKAGQEAADAKPSAGGTLGVPAPTVYPWANQSRALDANKVKAKEVERGGKEVEKDSDTARQETDTAIKAKRFLELNEKAKTGGLSDKVPLGRWAQSFGADYAEMQALTAELAPAKRIPGSGATSDFDAKQFERATVGVDKPQATNANIAAALVARAQTAQDYADFRQAYLEQNGTLSGSARYWKQYADKNPIFDAKAKEGSFTLNKGRKDWREFFAGGAAPAAAAPAAQPPVAAPAAVDFDALIKKYSQPAQ